LIVLNMAAHDNNGLPHQEHKNTPDECQYQDGDTA